MIKTLRMMSAEAQCNCYTTLYGQVTSEQGVPVAGVQIWLYGSEMGFAVTNAEGRYQIPNLSVLDICVIVPSKSGLTFNPEYQTFALLIQQHADFLADGPGLQKFIRPTTMPEEQCGGQTQMPPCGARPRQLGQATMRQSGGNPDRHWHDWVPQDKRIDTEKRCPCGARKFWDGRRWQVRKK